MRRTIMALTLAASAVIGFAVVTSSVTPTSAAAAKHRAKAKATHKKAKTKKPPPKTTTTAAVTGNFNSCSVVTQAEAASALGASVSPGVLGNATVEGGLACVFYGPSAPTPTTPNVAQPDTVRVVVVKGSDAVTWYNDYESKVHAQAITGYGDQAYYDGYASFSVMKGDAYLRIAVSPAGAPPSLADEEQLATAILPKL